MDRSRGAIRAARCASGRSRRGRTPAPRATDGAASAPTVTDANLLLGRLLEDSPLAGGLSLERSAAERVISALARELGMEPLECAEGIVRVAEAEMLGALRVMTVERGIDPRGFALMPFGGAGPLHAAALARELGISRLLCPRASGVLSALGLAGAAPRRDVARTVMLTGEALSAERLAGERDELLTQACGELAQAPSRIRVRYELRYRGQAFELPVDEELQVPQPGDALGPAGRPSAVLNPDALHAAFAAAHEQRYGYRDEDAPVELVNLRVSVWGPSPALRPQAGTRAEPARFERPIVLDGRLEQASVFVGEPAPGSLVAGPSLYALPEATLLVPPGWSGEVDEHGTIHLSRLGA